MACAPVVLGQWSLTGEKRASCWEVSGRRRACSGAADRAARQRVGSALINEGIWKTISGSRFAFNYLINQNSFNSMCSALCSEMRVCKHCASEQEQLASQQEARLWNTNIISLKTKDIKIVDLVDIQLKVAIITLYFPIKAAYPYIFQIFFSNHNNLLK